MAFHWRATIRKARRTLHQLLRLRASVYVGGDPASPPKEVDVRLDRRYSYIADIPGTAWEYAEMREARPSLIMMRDDHQPQRGDVFILEGDDGYRVDHVEPRDDITVRAFVIPLTKSERSRYP